MHTYQNIPTNLKYLTPRFFLDLIFEINLTFSLFFKSKTRVKIKPNKTSPEANSEILQVVGFQL